MNKPPSKHESRRYTRTDSGINPGAAAGGAAINLGEAAINLGEAAINLGEASGAAIGESAINLGEAIEAAIAINLGEAPAPNRPIRTAALQPIHWREGARFAGAEIPLGKLGGARDIGINLVTIPPGAQSCPYHWHLREEEHFYILEGRCVLRSGAERFDVQAGDYVCFPAGTRIAHCFENPHDAPCRVLAIGSRHDDEIAVYPDSGKMKLRALGAIVPFGEESLDYWHGERAHEPLEPHDDDD